MPTTVKARTGHLFLIAEKQGSSPTLTPQEIHIIRRATGPKDKLDEESIAAIHAVKSELGGTVEHVRRTMPLGDFDVRRDVELRLTDQTKWVGEMGEKMKAHLKWLKEEKPEPKAKAEQMGFNLASYEKATQGGD